MGDASAIGHGNGAGPGACELPGPSPDAEGDSTGVAGKRRGVGYSRVSTREQAEGGASLDSQRRKITAYAAFNELELLDIIEDAGETGKNLKRKGLQEALGMIERGEAEVLVVAKLDRLSRSLLDFVGLVAESRAKGWSIVAIDVNVDTGSASPIQQMLVNILMVFAEFERAVISQRTKDGLDEKRLQGKQLGRPSTLPVEVRRRIVRMRKAGRTLDQIASALNEDGVPTGQGGRRWWSSSVHAVLVRSGASL